MTTPQFPKDLVILTADKNGQFALRGLLGRPKRLGIRPIVDPVFVIHPHKDPGVIRHPEIMLRTFVNSCAHALVLMDWEGSGREELSAPQMEQEIEQTLRRNGWGDRSAAVVIEPELDVWVWSASPHVETVLGWRGHTPRLGDWLSQHEFLPADSRKPLRPKAALEAALREVRLPRSSTIYRDLAQKVSLANCTDRAFQKLRKTLVTWFPE